MKKSLRGWRLLILLFSFVFSLNGLACTSFRIAAKDGTVIIARTMEYARDLKTELRTSSRDRIFKTAAPDGKPGLSWKAKYGYLFLSPAAGDFVSDGMNEAGLSFEGLYFPGFATYQTVPSNKDSEALSYIYLGDWVLGNFKTVDEVRKALPAILVYAGKIPGMNDVIFPLHFSVYDATGKGIVIEYVDGKLNIHDNHIGVMTNSPNYDWHITNLKNYIHLKPVNPQPVIEDGITFAATGQGAGMIGLPGDISPPSRFVKMAVLLDVVAPAQDAAGALNLAEHVINNVDIPLGLAREPGNGNYSGETTQWVVFKDLTHKVLYYRTYQNLSLHSVSLAKLNFSINAPRLKMPIISPEYVKDVTAELTQHKDN